MEERVKALEKKTEENSKMLIEIDGNVKTLMNYLLPNSLIKESIGFISNTDKRLNELEEYKEEWEKKINKYKYLAMGIIATSGIGAFETIKALINLFIK